MSSPFTDRAFKYYWSSSAKDEVAQRAEILKENPPTVDQILEFVADVDNGRDIVDKLYYVYQTEALSSLIGWHVKPGNLGVGGLLKLSFYEKLLKTIKPEYVNHVFAFLPKELQTDEMLKSFVLDKNVKDTRISNFHGDTLKTSTLEWLIDNVLSTIGGWKKEWWTPELKVKAISKDPAAIAYMPSDIYTIDEVKQFLIKDGMKHRSHIRELWSNLPKKFKQDSEIFARFLILNGGLANNFNDFSYSPNSEFLTFEGIKKYFQLIDNPVFGEWKFIRKEWKQGLIDVALPKVFGAIALDLDIELTDEILNATLSNQLSDARRAKIAHRLQKEGRLTKELIEKMKLRFLGIDSLSDNELAELFNNSGVVEYLVKKRDDDFLNAKKNWPKGVKMKKEFFIDMVFAMNFSKAKITSRFNKVFNEDDYIWIFFESNKLEKKFIKQIKAVLANMARDGLVSVSKEVLDLLKNSDESGTYESFKAATDIFLF